MPSLARPRFHEAGKVSLLFLLLVNGPVVRDSEPLAARYPSGNSATLDYLRARGVICLVSRVDGAEQCSVDLSLVRYLGLHVRR